MFHHTNYMNIFAITNKIYFCLLCPVKKMVYQGKGQEVRSMCDRENLPRKEQMIRNQIKREGLWVR